MKIDYFQSKHVRPVNITPPSQFSSSMHLFYYIKYDNIIILKKFLSSTASSNDTVTFQIDMGTRNQTIDSS